MACARSALPSKRTSRTRLSVEAYHRVGTAVFAGARGRSAFAPANLPLWKVDEQVDGVVQPSVVDFSRRDVGLLVFVEHSLPLGCSWRSCHVPSGWRWSMPSS